jgi:polyhydroxyalkanoate synthesis regulator phasin
MKAKTLVQLLSLSTSLYMISKDEQLMSKVGAAAKKGKEKLNDLYRDLSEESEESLTDKILQKAMEAKAELEKRIEETVITVYDKMKIAHTNEIKDLHLQLSALKKELTQLEVRIAQFEKSE